MRYRRSVFLVAVVAAAAGLPMPYAHAQTALPADRCLQGFVWREVVPADHVCVAPETRAQVLRDNAQAAARRQPGGGAYGPDTCRTGYVWREAVPNDRVCVSPATRRQAALDNSQAAARRVPTTKVPAQTVPAPVIRDHRSPTPAPEKPAQTQTPPPAPEKPSQAQTPPREPEKPAQAQLPGMEPFLQTLPGILTAMAAVIGALASLVLAFRKRN